MKSLYELLDELRKQLINENGLSGNIMAVEDIHRIRKGLPELNLDNDFLNNRFDFSSIKNYFFEYDNFGNEQNGGNELIMKIIDPILIELLDNDYEVNIRKISTSEIVDKIYPNLVSMLDDMEDAYHNNDYRRVTTLSSTILQSIFKEICDKQDIQYTENEKFPALFKKVKNLLKLNPSEYKGNENLKKFCSIINEIVIKLNQLRNLYSESHGTSAQQSLNYERLPKHHVKLIVDSTKTSVNFLLDSFDYQANSLKL